MTTPIPHVRFDFAAYPREQRFELWRQAMAGTYDAELVDSDPQDFAAEVDSWALGELLLTHSRLPALRFTRDPGKIKQDGNDYYSIILIASGGWTTDFDGRMVTADEGDVVGIDLSRPLRGSGKSGDNITASLPHHLLDQVMRAQPDLHGVKLDGPLRGLLGDHLKSVVRILPTLSAAEGTVVARTTVQLIGACFAASARAKAQNAPLVAFAVRKDVQRYIDQHLNAPDLGPERICRDLGLSRSAIYRAFSGTDGIAGYIQKERLAAARRMLLHPEEHRGIAEIAASVGFASQSSFSHAFRREFGQSPREARSEGLAIANRSAIELSSVVTSNNFGVWLEDLERHLAPPDA